MFYRFYLLAFIILNAIGFSQQVSTITFEIKNFGLNVDGHFNTFNINATIDENGKLNDLQGQIDVTSVRTGIEKRDNHLLEEDYFFTEKYKNITLRSTRITEKSEELYRVEADLYIKGNTKQVVIYVKLEKQRQVYKLRSNFEINRLDFDIGDRSFAMGKTVNVEVVHYEAFK